MRIMNHWIVEEAIRLAAGHWPLPVLRCEYEKLGVSDFDLRSMALWQSQTATSVCTERTLLESEALPSVGLFVECLLSGTRQSSALGNKPLYRVLDTWHRTALGKDMFAECQALGKGPSTAVLKLTAVTFCREPRTGTRQRGFFAECLVFGTRQRRLCRVSSVDTRQTIFLFLHFGHQTFCGMFLHYVDLHVPFWDNYNSVCNS
jgi:hypothetical protein